MELRPGFRQTEVGTIPEDWEISPLEAFTSFISYGFTNPMPTSEGGVYMLTAKDINHGKIQFDTARCTTEEAYRSLLTAKSRPKKGDLLLTKDGTLGRLAIVGNETVCINQSVAVMRPNAKAAAQFLKVLLEAPPYQNRMLEDAGGSTIKHIYITIVNQMPVAVPPTKAEQEAIAAALSDADALIETLEQLLVKKRNIKQGAMQDLLTGKERLPGFETNRGFKKTDIGAIPADWDVVSLNALGQFKNGINKSSEAFGHGSPFVNLMDVFGVSSIASCDTLGLVDTNTAEQQTYALRKGDVIIIRSSVKPSGVGLTAVVENDLPNTVYSGFLIRFRDRGALCDAFKRHCFCEEGFRKRVIAASSVSANTNINQDNLKRLLLALPPNKAEQEAIAAIVSDMDGEICALETKLVKARRIKQGMMQELLTGKIRLV
jgi:type I restriction enzyme, S subunit